MNDISSVSIAFSKWFCCKRVCIAVLNRKTVCVGTFIRRNFFIGRKYDRFVSAGQIFTFINSSRNISNLLDRKSALKGFCDLNDRMLSHSIRNQICAGIHKDTSSYSVIPVIIVCQTSETGLNAAQNDRCMLISLTDQVTVYNSRHIRTESHLTTWRVRILLAMLS